MKKFAILLFSFFFPLVLLAQSDESNHLFAKGADLYAKGKYAEALQNFKKCWQLDSLQLAEDNERRNYSLQWLASCLYKLNRIDEAVKQDAYGFCLPPVDRRTTEDIDAISHIGMKAYNDGNIDEAIRNATRCLQMEHEKFGEHHYYVAGTHEFLSVLYMYQQNLPVALEHIEACIDIFKTYYPEAEAALWQKIEEKVTIIKNLMAIYSGDIEPIMTEQDNAVEYFISTGNPAYDECLLDALSTGIELSVATQNIARGDVYDKYLTNILRRLNDDDKVKYALAYYYHSQYVIQTANLDLTRNAMIRPLQDELTGIIDLLRAKGNNQDIVYAWLLISRAQFYLNIGNNMMSNQDAIEAAGILELPANAASTNPADIASNYMTIANNCAFIGQFLDGIKYSQKALKLISGLPNSDEYAYTAFFALGRNYAGLSQVKNAIESFDAAESHLKKIDNYQPSYLADIHYARANLYSSVTTDIQLAYENAKAARDIYKTNGMIYTNNFFESTYICSTCLATQSKKEEAEQLLNELRQIVATHPDEVSKCNAYANITYNEAIIEYNMSNFAEAERKCRQAIEFARQASQSDYCSYSFKLAQCLISQRSVNDGIAILDSLSTHISEIHNTNSDFHAQILETLAGAYGILHNIPKLKLYAEQAIKVYDNLLGENNMKDARCLITIARWLQDSGENLEAKGFCDRAVKIITKQNGQNSEEMSAALSVSISIDLYMLNTDAAFSKAQKLLTLYESKGITQMGAYGQALLLYAKCLAQKNDYVNAITYYKKALEQMQEKDGSRYNANCGVIFNDLATVARNMGNYSDAETYQNIALEIIEHFYGKSSMEYILNLMNQASTALSTGDNDKALELANQALELVNSTIGENATMAISMKTYIAVVYGSTGQIDKGIELCKQVITKLKQNTPLDTYATLTNLYFQKAQYAEALKVLKEEESIIGKRMGTHTQNFNNIIIQQANAYYMMPQYDNAAKLTRKVYASSRDFLLNNFTTMTNQERFQFWTTAYPFFHNMIPSVCLRTRYTRDDARLVYDATLLSNGLLLETDRQISDLVYTKGTTDLQTLYASFLQDKDMLNKLTDQQETDDNNERMRIAARINNLRDSLEVKERKVVQQIKAEIGDFTQSLRISWKDIKDKLTLNDIAIEFIEYQYNDTIYGAAITMKASYDAPHLHQLYRRHITDNSMADDCYTTPTLYNTLWTPLQQEIANTPNIYFATQGLLCNIAIESLPTLQDTSNQHNYYRLTSTRTLALPNTPKGQDAVIYGGLDYEMTTQAMQNDALSYPQGVKRSAERTSGSRAIDVIQPLPGTLAEAQQITTTINQNNTIGLKAQCITDTLGTETSFKALSGVGKRILHIATHGYYITPEQAATGEVAFYTQLTYSHDNRTEEDKMLQRSGLLFSGASNRYLGYDDLPIGIDDGILSAQEIATLNFSGLDLVVLSACDTARGDITGDGVFGLQRAFKKAGAQAIIMSLWKVDDQATQTLMTEFYTNWMQRNMSKHNAFEAAKLKTRTLFPAPEYWAAFILVDALD